MNEQKRFLLAMLLSGAVLIVWQLYFAPPPPEIDPATGEPVVHQQDGATTGGDASVKADSGSTGATATPAKPAKVVAPRADTMVTDQLGLKMTNRGARVSGFEIREPAQYLEAGDLLGAYPEGSSRYPFDFTITDGTIALGPDVVFEVVEPKTPDEAARRVVYRHVDPQGRFQVEKAYTAADSPNSVKLDVTVTNLTDQPVMGRPHLTVTGYNDPSVEKSWFDFRPDELEGICRIDGDTERELYASLKDGATERFGTPEEPVVWAGAGTRYFLWAAVPTSSQPDNCVLSVVDNDYLNVDMVWNQVTIAPKSSYTLSNTIYMGQKDLDLLEDVGHDLSESVDYGLFTILALPLRWLLNIFHSWLGNWGFAILLLTLLIKILTWPILGKTYENTERMKELQPQLDALRAKYENDQQRLGEETMKLFSEHKFNPLGGCLPMLLQMPIFYGLFVMINNSVELYQADFIFWYTDLSAPDPYFLLPILMGAIMLLQQQWMTPPSTGGANAQQMQTVMKIMPIMFTGLMLFLPSGLVLYYCLNLIIGVLQQFLIRRKYANKREAAA